MDELTLPIQHFGDWTYSTLIDFGFSSAHALRERMPHDPVWVGWVAQVARLLLALGLPHLAGRLLLALGLPHLAGRQLLALGLPHLAGRLLLDLGLPHLAARLMLGLQLGLNGVLRTGHPQLSQEV
jgi:hypothetical protein